MSLYSDILTKILADHVVEMTSYNILQKIKSVIDDDTLSDEECFLKIEKIISLLEDAGSDGDFRHDF